MSEYLSKFQYGEKFERLPDQMEINARGHLVLARTKIDMIPAGLKGVYFVFMDKKPRYIAPDFDGAIMYYDSKHIADMDRLDVQLAKARYIAEREKVEKPRYIREKDGTLSLCSLPTNMRVFCKPFEGGYFLDLRKTSIREKQNFGGIRDTILYPKQPVQMELDLFSVKKVATHKGRQPLRQNIKTIA